MLQENFSQPLGYLYLKLHQWSATPIHSIFRRYLKKEQIIHRPATEKQQHKRKGIKKMINLYPTPIELKEFEGFFYLRLHINKRRK